MNTLTVTVSDLCENFVYHYIYINKETYQEQLGVEPEYKSAYAIVKEGTDVHGAAAALSDRKDVLAVTVIMDMRERIGNMMRSMDYIVALIKNKSTRQAEQITKRRDHCLERDHVDSDIVHNKPVQTFPQKQADKSSDPR